MNKLTRAYHRFIPMSVDELIRQITVKHEKDFRRIKLHEGSNLSVHPDYESLNNYLRQADLYKEPLDFF